MHDHIITTDSLTPSADLVADLNRFLSAEIANALGLQPEGRLHRLLDPLFRLPAGRLARLLATADAGVARDGFSAGAGWLAQQLALPALVRGQENVPTEGPLLVMSNHPGAYDSLALIQALRRDDLLVVISPIRALMRLPHSAAHFVQVKRGQGHATTRLNQARGHLMAGGAVLIFPTGVVDPDPDVMPGAAEALGSWSSSIGLLLNAAPETQALPAIISRVLSPGWMRFPLVRLQPDGPHRRRLAEVLQLSQLVLMGRQRSQAPRLSFAPPMRLTALGADLAPALVRDRLVAHARELLAAHAPAFAG